MASNRISVAEAKALIDRGRTDVRPLQDGVDAWRRAGYPVEPRDAAVRR